MGIRQASVGEISYLRGKGHRWGDKECLKLNVEYNVVSAGWVSKPEPLSDVKLN